MGVRTLVAALCLLAVAKASDDNPYADFLHGRGIETTPAGLAAFLRRCIPVENTTREIDELIRTLSHEDPALREAAARRLSRIPFLARHAVHQAAQAGDPEVRRLCIRIQQSYMKSRYDEVLSAVLHTIQYGKFPGLVEITLAAIPYCEEPYFVLPARRALVATARAADAPQLRAALAHENTHVREAAIEALLKVLGRRSLPDLRRMLADGNDAVRLTVAESLATLAERRSLPVLAQLLDSEQAQVRHRAVTVLRAITGKQFEYIPYLEAPARAGAARQWREFIAAKGDRIRLRLPLVLSKRLLNRTLICNFATKRLEDYDHMGRRFFQSAPLALPWGCHGLPNGHRLVAVFSKKVVIEYNRKGREVWRTKTLPGRPMSVRRLDNGNTLVACGESGKVVEIDLAGAVAWSVTLPGRPSDARRLRDGRTLVTLYMGKRVVEIDGRGTILWQIRGAGTPSTAERLGNGNTLVAGLANRGVVTEYDRAGRPLWNLKGLGTVYDVQRLDNGNTLVSTTRGAAEYNRQGRIVWRKNVGHCRVMRY